MAQTDSLSVVSLDPVLQKMEVKENQQVRKMKQARLPFMPIDHDQKMLKTTTPPGSKKRKLSDNDTPSPKQAKVAAHSQKPISPNGDAEVSSSSEAEPAPAAGHQKGARKFAGTLDRFLFKKREERHEEITSTNDVEPMSIDLTDDSHESDNVDSIDSKSSATEKDKVNNADESKSEPKDNNSKVQEVKNTEKAESATTNKDSTDDENDIEIIKEINSPKTVIQTKETAGTIQQVDTDNKENVEQDASIDEDDEINKSFVSDTSVCEAALKTPAKDKPLESVLKTPVVTAKKDISSPANQSPGTTSEATPKSAGKKRSKPMSENKQKEKEALRLQREKEKEEKRLQKEREKEEKEKERLEKKRQKDEEKAEKERLKLEEKEKKEKERLEKLQQKEDEKKKKEEQIQAKLEEKRKKDEERKQKEEEKRLKEEEKLKEEEEKLKKKEKIAQSFKSFFIEKTPADSPPKVKEGKSQFFMPFEMKPNMRLAPTKRVNVFPPEAKERLDQCLLKQDSDDLYIGQLKKGMYKKRKSGKTYPRELAEEEDIEIMCHDAETIKKTMHKVKFLKFSENTRPPYYGTWTKPSTTLSARNPFRQDEALFDYEVDSDDEWEEEDPGESVSSDEEEEEKDKDEEDDDENDWMVPHGYLSDDEGVPDEEVDSSKRKQLQAARQEAWEREIKMQTQPLRMISLGCVWEGETTAIAAKQLEKLLSFKAVCLRNDPIPTSFTRTEALTATAKSEPNTPRLGMKKSVPEEAMPDLIRLLHGNPVGVKKLIREFRMYWKLKTSKETSSKSSNANEDETVNNDQSESQGEESENPLNVPNDTSMEVDGDAPNTPPNDKGDKGRIESQLAFAISKTQLEAKIKEIAVRDKRGDDKVASWYVKDDVLKQYKLEDIQLPNSWEYVEIKAPTWASTNKGTPKVEEPGAIKLGVTSGRATPTIPSITQFTQAMSPAQIQARQAQASPVAKPVAKATEPKAENPALTDSETAEGRVDNQIEEKPALPKDQSTIMSFFKPATSSPKSVQRKVIGKAAVENDQSVAETVPADNKSKEQNGIKTGEKVTNADLPQQKSDEVMAPKDCLKVVSQIKRNCSVLLEKLEQPLEKVAKVDSASKANKNAEIKAQTKTETKMKEGNSKVGQSDHEPMEMEVIVLD